MRRFCIGIATLFVSFRWHVGGYAAQPSRGNALHPGNVLLASAQEAPRMQLSETSFDFKEVLEGSIVSVETDLKEKVDYQLETVQKGQHYRLNVTNTAKEGTYSGFIRLSTNLSAKPTITIRVSGNVEN
jgi:hypothetical protein